MSAPKGNKLDMFLGWKVHHATRRKLGVFLKDILLTNGYKWNDVSLCTQKIQQFHYYS